MWPHIIDVVTGNICTGCSVCFDWCQITFLLYDYFNLWFQIVTYCFRFGVQPRLLACNFKNYTWKQNSVVSNFWWILQTKISKLTSRKFTCSNFVTNFESPVHNIVISQTYRNIQNRCMIKMIKSIEFASFFKRTTNRKWHMGYQMVT